jgi:GTP cyclohydrolase II
MADKEKHKSKHIKLTSHTGAGGVGASPIVWGAADPKARGPIIATLTDPDNRNAIGTHSGSYAVYRALAIAARALDPLHKPDLTNTAPTDIIGPFPAWHDPVKMVSVDPYGAMVAEVFKSELDKGIDIRPTIAVTKASIDMPEIVDAIEAGRIPIDGKIVKNKREIPVTKAAVEPVWYLPGIAKRFDCTESELRRTLFEQTGGMFPELVTRGDLDVFLPPIGGQTVYIFGDPKDLANPDIPLTARVHDECNGSDVFGSDICTCRRMPSKSVFAAPKMVASAWWCTSAKKAEHLAK